jgi:L-rhamnose isomerase
MDNGHYHPTEVVSDKISSLLAFYPTIALHVTRPVRWDSDHVVRFDDETREIAKEIVAAGRLQDVKMALDYFDASINRVAAWIIGIRNFHKALLEALLTPHAHLKALQDAGRGTELLMQQEELKTYPMGAVWEEFCRRESIPTDEAWFAEVLRYEQDVQSKRV